MAKTEKGDGNGVNVLDLVFFVTTFSIFYPKCSLCCNLLDKYPTIRRWNLGIGLISRRQKIPLTL